MEFSNQMGGEHFICGGLNINGPHNFMYFNAKFWFVELFGTD